MENGSKNEDKILPVNLSFIKGNLLVLSISSGLWRVTSHLVNPFYPLYVLALGGNYFSIGLIAAVGGVATIIPTLVGGHLADTQGRKKIIGLLTILMGPIKLIRAFAPSWTYLLIARGINSVLSGLRGPAFSAIMADSLDPENRGKGYGLWSSLPMIPALFSPALGGIFIEQMGVVDFMRIGYVLVAIAATVAGFLRLFFLKETFEGKQKKKTLKESLSSIIEVGKQFPSSLKVILVVGVAGMFGRAVTRRFRVTYATEVIGLSASAWGFLYTIIRSLRVIVVPFLGHTVDKLGRKKLLLTSSVIILFMDFGFIFSGGFYTALFTFGTYYTIRQVRRTAIKALRADFSPREKRGKIYCIFRIFSRPSRRIGTLLGGFLYGIFPVASLFYKTSPFYTEILIALAICILTVFFINEPEERER